jgi:hypothetical protein
MVAGKRRRAVPLYGVTTVTTRGRGANLIREHNRLAGDFKALTATHIFADHEIVFSHHVGTGFGEAGAIALIGAAGELAFFGTDQPGDFIFARLVAVRTVERCWFLFWPFVKKFALFHGGSPAATFL